jgi:TonB family protein
VQPQYTAPAMRAGIEGTVILGCVIGEEGTVRDCEVVKSLDPTNGLDQAALAAAKQWRYEPGTKNGVPVPVRVTIEMAFRIPAPERWPPVFDRAAMPSAAAWTESRVPFGGATVSVLHSSNWQIGPATQTGQGAARFVNAAEHRMMVIYPPRPLPPGPPRTSLSVSEVQRVAEASDQAPLPNGIERVGFGYVRTSAGPAVWAELYVPATVAAELASLPPALRDLMLSVSSGARTWAFYLLAEGNMIPISFSVEYPAGRSDDENAPLAEAAAAEFRRILVSLRFTPN